MKIDLDIPVNIGDSIFFFDVARPKAQITNIYIEYEEYREKPRISFGWAQSDYGPDGWELWDEGEIDLDDLGTTFWLTYGDMLRANRKKLTEYQLTTDQAFRDTYGEEIEECDISKRIGCDGCEYGNICQYQNKEI